MKQTPHVVGVCGSRRAESVTHLTLQHVGDGVTAVGGTYDTLLLDDYELPPLNPDTETPPAATTLTDTLQSADAIILGTPVYHGSYSGVLKNALDYAGFDEFEGKTVGLVAVAGGRFPTPALNHLRDVCRSVNAWVIPHQVAVPDASNVAGDTELTDPDLVERAETLGHKAVQYIDIEQRTATFASQENKGG